MLTLIRRQTRYNIVGYLRSPRTVFFSFIFPLGLLSLFCSTFAKAGTTTKVNGQVVDAQAFFTGGLIAYAVVVSTFTGVVVLIVTAREGGWLKRFRGTPMPPTSFHAAQILYRLVTSVVLAVLMLGFAAVTFGLHLRVLGVLAVLCFTIIGVFCFVAVGLALSSWLTTPDMANAVGSFSIVILAFISGVFLPTDLLPSWLVTLASYFPLEPLARSMQLALAVPHGSGFALKPMVVLGCWGIAGLLVARRTFSWQPLGR